MKSISERIIRRRREFKVHQKAVHAMAPWVALYAKRAKAHFWAEAPEIIP